MVKSVAAWAGVVLAGLAGLQLAAQGRGAAASQTPAPTAPADTAALRAQYEQWRKDFKTWGKWAPDRAGEPRAPRASSRRRRC